VADPDQAESAGAQPAAVPGATGIGLLVVIAICGFASLGLEVAWTRMLILIVGTTTYAFATMLASFLVGITLGSFIARAIIDRLRDVRRTLGWVQVGIALTTLATAAPCSAASARAGEPAGWVARSRVGWPMTMTRFGVSFLVMSSRRRSSDDIPARWQDLDGARCARSAAISVRCTAPNAGQHHSAPRRLGFFILPAIGLQKSVAVMASMRACHIVAYGTSVDPRAS